MPAAKRSIDTQVDDVYNPAMSTWLYGWLALAGVVALLWIAWLIALFHMRRKRHILGSRTYMPRGDAAPLVSIIIAAKDEQDHIEACVSGLLTQDYPSFEIIVVDDRSRDGTPAILRRLHSQAADRLSVMTISELPDGWFGKSHAMHRGIAASRGEWLLFTDADCRFHSPVALSMAMHEVMAEEVDFLCITPILEARTTWERIIQPVCALMLMVWFLPHRVNKSEKKTAYANGAFMLLHRDCYHAIGGHESVRTELNEDIQLARLAKGAGFRLRVVENDDLYSTRMYDSFGQAWRGWGRIFYGGLKSLRRLALSALLLCVFSIGPWVSLLTAAIGWLTAHDDHAGWTAALGAWLMVVAIEQFVVWRAYRLLRAGSIWSTTYVLGSVVTLGVIGSAMLKAMGATGTSWRGTTYSRSGAKTRHAATRSVSCPEGESNRADVPPGGPDAMEERAAHV